MRSESDIRFKIKNLLERSKYYEGKSELKMSLGLIHRVDELRWVLEEIDDNYDEVNPQPVNNGLWNKI
jgi:hypothetical protein